MKTFLLPDRHLGTPVEKISVSKNMTLGTTTGLVKADNEDMLGAMLLANEQRFCIADGHWGKAAAQDICRHILKARISFPGTRADAIALTSHIEKQLFLKLGQPTMDEAKDFTPEASFAALHIANSKLRVLSYGDCRMLLVRNGHVAFELQTTETWLGAFSHLALRKRLPIQKALVFQELPLEKGDTILLFTDGVDQCVYEQPTISIAQLTRQANRLPDEVFDGVISMVFKHGAEDNASLAVVRIDQ